MNVYLVLGVTVIITVLIGVVLGIAVTMIGKKPPAGVLHMIFDDDGLADMFFEVTGGDLNAIAKESMITLFVSKENAPK